MKKLLDLDAVGAARVHLATTWSCYFEGERFFEGTRSLFTAGGIEKPVLNAYRMLGRLGDTRLTAESSHAWSVDRLDEGEAGMPEEIDALATSRAGTGVQVLVCGTPTTTSAPSGTARPRAHRPEQTETVRNGALSLRIALPLPSVSLVEITPAA